MYNKIVIKYILFDFDGTIANSFNSFLEIVNVLSDKYHLNKISPTEIDLLRSEDAKTLIKKMNVPFYKLPFLAHDMKKLQRKMIKNIKPIEKMPDILQELKKDYKLGVLTSNGYDNVNEFLELNQINYFDYIIDNVSLFSKDRAINKFLNKHKINKNEIIYLGDEIRDILACKKANVEIISVSWGFNSKEGLHKFNPDYLIDNPKEIIRILKLLN